MVNFGRFSMFVPTGTVRFAANDKATRRRCDASITAGSTNATDAVDIFLTPRVSSRFRVALSNWLGTLFVSADRWCL